MRVPALILFSLAISCAGVAGAQGEPATRTRVDARQDEASEEIVVRGRRLTELRFEVQQARERAYDIFNDVNSDDQFDVRCRDESQVFTKVKRNVCRARFEDDISSNAAQEYMATLRWSCRPNALGEVNLTDCMFSQPGASAAARSAAQGAEAQAPAMRDLMSEEILRVARQDERFAQAILDWYEASQQYEAAQGARSRRED